MEYFRSHRHTVNKSRSASIVVGYVNTSEVGVVLGFLFAFCTCVSLNFNSKLFLYHISMYVFVSLLIFAYFARSKTEAVSPLSYSFFVDE